MAMTTQSVTPSGEARHSSMAIAFVLCSLSGCVMGFILGLVAGHL